MPIFMCYALVVSFLVKVCYFFCLMCTTIIYILYLCFVIKYMVTLILKIMANVIVILDGVGYLVPVELTKNRNELSEIEKKEYKNFVKTFPIHGEEKSISNKEFSNLENKNWHR